MAHNISIEPDLLRLGLVPPLFLLLLASNALMVGTYTGVASALEPGLARSRRSCGATA